MGGLFIGVVWREYVSVRVTIKKMRGAEVLLMLVVCAAVVFLVLYTLEANTGASQRIAFIRGQSVYDSASGQTRYSGSQQGASQRYNAVIGMSRVASFPGFTASNPFDSRIDRVYFINMDHRTDRLADIRGEFGRMGVPAFRVQRIAASRTGSGRWGVRRRI